MDVSESLGESDTEEMVILSSEEQAWQDIPSYYSGDPESQSEGDYESDVEEVPPTIIVLDDDVHDDPQEDPVPGDNDGERPRGRSFRMRAKKFFLTYPRCDVDPDHVLSKIKERFGEDSIKWAVVGREHHADGGFHLHCAMWLLTTVDTRDAHYWDFLTGQHGNYRVMKKPVECVEYCTKEGYEVACYGIMPSEYVEARKRKQSSKFSVVAKRIKEDGASVQEINNDDPGFVCQNLSKLIAYQSFCAATASPVLRPWPPLQDLRLPAEVGPKRIFTWLKENLIGFPDRPFGTPQLYIHGTTGLGKTSLVRVLAMYSKIYYMPDDGRWMDTFDGSYDLVVFDEFRGGKTIQFMNQFLDGSFMQVPRRNAPPFLKQKNVPCIILSNLSVESVYHKVQESAPDLIAALTRRLEIIQLSYGENLFEVCDMMDSVIPDVNVRE